MPQTVLLYIAVSLRIISNPLGNVFQKQLTEKGINPLIVNFITYLLLSVVCLFLLFFIPFAKPISGTFWLFSVLGGIAGALGNGFLVRALNLGELSVLGPVNSYKSVIGLVTGIFVLGEIPGIRGIIGVFMVIAGSYFVLDTTKERFTLNLLKRRDIQFRLIAMILTAIEAVVVKKIIISSSVGTAFLSWCFSGALFSFLLLPVYRIDLKKEFREAARPENQIIFLFLISCIAIMQFTTNYAFKNMPVGYALSLFQLSVILSILFGYRFFKEKNIYKKIIGAVIMITGSIIILLE